MSIDVEELVRRTYADVAERTTIAPPGETVLVPVGRPGRRWRVPVVAAVTVAIVVAGLMVLRRDEPAPAVDETALTHVLPGSLRSLAADPSPSLVRTLALRTISSRADLDSIVYGTEEATLSIEARRGPAMRLLVEPNTELADGTPAVLERDPLALTWDHHLVQVRVRLIGGDEQILRTVADGLIYVDDAAWAAATDHAGFVHVAPDARAAGVVATYQLATSSPLTVNIGGRLHDGFRIEFPSDGVVVSVGNTTERCRASASFVFGDGPPPVVVLTDSPRTVAISADGGTPLPVDVTVPIPGTGLFVETLEQPYPKDPSVSWECREATR